MTYLVRYYKSETDTDPGTVGNFDTQYECVEWAAQYRLACPAAYFDVIDVETGLVRLSLLPVGEK